MSTLSVIYKGGRRDKKGLSGVATRAVRGAYAIYREREGEELTLRKFLEKSPGNFVWSAENFL
jgi:hypothetical protein